MFWIYLMVIVAGLGYSLAVALRHG